MGEGEEREGRRRRRRGRRENEVDWVVEAMDDTLI